MKTTIQINDGNSVLHTATREFDELPTVGDKIEIDTGASPDLKGYKSEAEVMLIETDVTNERKAVILRAVPEAGPANRPTLVMNLDYVPKRHRREAESFLRKHFETPAFEWIESDRPQPIIDVHASPKPPVQELRKITDELRDLLLKDAPVSVAR